MQTKRFWLAGMMATVLLATVPGTGRGITIPDTVTLHSQSKLYEPFVFPHAKHILIVKECSNCHHHTTGTLVQDPNCIRCHRNSSETAVVSCKGCHLPDAFTATAIKEKNKKIYHRDMPSLKAAMHQSCIDCHNKMKQGPVGCQDCHVYTKEGAAFYNSGEFAPKKKPAKGSHGGH
ncbi:MAG: cytochrome c3 family protein [Desulfuromonadaceae bacterium]|nr:cytochrome c3 family protein [Desulfuromonadaceae bacterium]MDD5107263.1 cytochrome c3 family protein [Desulfuromonadaceae bacterium]